MLTTAGEVRTNTKVTFSYGLLHMDTPVSAEQQSLTYINSSRTQPGAMDDRDGWQESQGVFSNQQELMIII